MNNSHNFINCGLVSSQNEAVAKRGAMRIYPNPGDAAQVVIAYELQRPAGKLHLAIYNAGGQLLRQHTQPAAGAERGEITLEISTLPAGLYWLSLRAGEAVMGDSLLIR